MQLIIIQGESGTGKTGLAMWLAEHLEGCGIFLKDAYKEQQYDRLFKPPSLSAWIKIENMSWQAMYAHVRQAISSNRSLIIEGNFKRPHRQQLQLLLKSNVLVVEVYCYAKGWLPLRRFVARNHSGQRHPGHRDHLWYMTVFSSVLLAKIGIVTYRTFATLLFYMQG